jgi:hypothetical protein
LSPYERRFASAEEAYNALSGSAYRDRPEVEGQPRVTAQLLRRSVAATPDVSNASIISVRSAEGRDL